MNGDLQNLVAYRLERARETLEDARVIAERGHSGSCVNRVYYACFYAVSALLASSGFSSSKHSGIRSLFGRHFVNTGIVSAEHGRFYNDLFELRQESDYDDFVRVDPATLPEMMERASQFVSAISGLIER